MDRTPKVCPGLQVERQRRQYSSLTAFFPFLFCFLFRDLDDMVLATTIAVLPCLARYCDSELKVGHNLGAGDHVKKGPRENGAKGAGRKFEPLAENHVYNNYVHGASGNSSDLALSQG